jgi:hypothetical protein
MFFHWGATFNPTAAAADFFADSRVVASPENLGGVRPYSITIHSQRFGPT